MTKVAERYGCGRAMWEYSSSENRFGTPEALMLLPYWTDNCVDSMEGLLMESSPTTPYHYLDQSELSVAPSDPQVGLDYGPLDVAEGVRAPADPRREVLSRLLAGGLRAGGEAIPS